MKRVKTVALAFILVCIPFFQSEAQSKILNNILEKATQAVTGIGDITGTWVYTGSACNFESTNILKQAGGAVAASQVEKQFDEYLTKLGIKKGACEFTFNEDNTYSATLSKTNLSGDYTLDEASKTVTLTYLKGVAKINAAVEKSGDNLQLLFDADNLLKLLKVVSSATDNSTLNAITTITDAYDGVQLGFDLQKQD